MSFKELFDEAETGVVQSSVPEGTYDVVVTAARPFAQSSLIFLTLQILNGPSAGKETDVSLYFPGEGAKRGARVYFARKMAGFIAYPDVKAAGQASDNAPTVEAALELIANALIGKQVVAEIGLRTDGEYAGSNELKATRAPDGVVRPAAPTAAVNPVTQPAPAAQPTPAAQSIADGVVPF
jgi:hypothetical protein